MKKMKMILEAVIVVTVVLALVLPGSAVITNVEESEYTKTMIIPTMIKSDYRLKKAPIGLEINAFGRGDDIPLSTDEGDEFTPAVVKDNYGNLWCFCIWEETVTSSLVFLKKSTDDGQTWDETWYLQSEEGDYLMDPVAVIDADGLLWAAFTDEGPDTHIFLPGQDTSVDPIDWEWHIFQSDTATDHHHLGSIATYHSEDTAVVGWCYIADIEYDPYGLFPDTATIEHNGRGADWTYTWDGDFQDIPSSYPSIGASNDLFFFAFQYTDEGAGKEIVNVRWGDAVAQPDVQEWDNEWGTFETSDSFNAIKPTIAGSGNNIVLVYQSDAAGNQDLKCSYSTNNGESWTHDITVVNDGADEENPRVFISGTQAYCIYVKNNNLYLIKSEDGGATWGSSEQINDESGSVENMWRTAEINVPSVVWTDDRGEDLDIWYDSVAIGNPPGAPDITGPSEGEPNVPITFKFNAVDPDGDQVKYHINWGDGGTDTTGLNPSGQDVELSHTWTQNDFTFTITAQAEDEDGGFGPIETKDIYIPRPRGRFYNLFDIFPNLFRFLNIIFG
jgi:hypothetical protein